MKLLARVCCAHCAAQLVAGARAEFPGAEIALFWSNPNIHPLIEYRRRLKAVKMLAERLKMPLVLDDRYGLVEFCRAIHGREALGERCKVCYALRLGAAAKAAREGGFDAFTSTLVTSRHQDHALIRAAGEAAGAKVGVEFVYRDWREATGEEKWTAMLYKQQYCGCVFSEYDRFKDTIAHVWPVPERAEAKA